MKGNKTTKLCMLQPNRFTILNPQAHLHERVIIVVMSVCHALILEITDN